MKTIIIPVNTLAEKRGGLVKAAIKKANILADIKDYKIVILVLSYQKNLDEVVMRMQKKGKLSEKLEIINVIQFLKPKTPIKTSNLSIKMEKLVNKLKRTNLSIKMGRLENKLEKIKDRNYYRFYDNGTYVMFKATNKSNNRIEYIDYFKKGRVRFLREEYNFRGELTRFVEFSTNNKPTMHRYVDRKKNCFLSIWIDEKTQEWRRAIDFSTNKEYKGMAEFYIDIINKIVLNFENPVIFRLFNDKLNNMPNNKKNLDYIIANLDPAIKKIASLHNTHLQRPYDDITKIQTKFRNLLEDRKFDRIVVLTPQQKEDIMTEFNREVEVIPNSYNFTKSATDHPKDINRILMLSRIAPKKRVDQAIEIMKIISQNDPDIYLDFYGFSYKDALEKDVHDLVNKYELKNFNFKGFTSDIESEISKSGMTILTSDTEAFPLSIMESIAQNVPSISFDIKYGPSDMIINGVNGYLVERDNLDEFANKILECKSRLEKGDFDDISGTIMELSEDNIRDKWFKLIESL